MTITNNDWKRFYRYTALALLLLTAINALVAGVLFMTDPSGGLMGMNLAYIKESPFESYFLPGMILFNVNGIFNMLAAYFLWKQLPYAAWWVMIQGILLGGWIVVQVIMVKDIAPLHIIMFIIGALLTLLGWLLGRWKE